MRHYIALIHKDACSDYGVSFPDLPGAITGEAAPEPSSLEENRDGVAVLIPAN